MFFWNFLIYGFGGYLLEKWYARRTGAEKQTRKGLILLPLCPVYGLALAVMLELPTMARAWPWLPLTACVICSAVEYTYHWACEKIFSVRFWDYTGIAGSVRGRISLPFSLAWGILGALVLTSTQPWLDILMRRIPPAVTFAATLLLTTDAVCSARLLYATRNTESLRLQTLLQLKKALSKTDSNL